MEQFRFEETKIPGVVVIYPNVHGDERGYFWKPTSRVSSKKQASPGHSFRIMKALLPKAC